jgi:hypothetical protein
LKILALDTGYFTGYAIGRGTPETTQFGTMNFRYAKDDAAELGFEFSIWLSRLLTEHEPNRPFLRGKASWSLSGLVWEVHRCAFLRRIPRYEFAPMQIKKFACGSYKASKDDMLTWALWRGFNVRTDHKADAVAIMLMAGESIPVSAPEKIH